LRELVGAQALPLAEVDLTQAGGRLRPQPDHRLDRLRRLEGALQVARIEPREPAPGQPASQPLGLSASLLGQWRIELALDAVLTVPRRLAVADEEQPRR
jgi:hypothetical protein